MNWFGSPFFGEFRLVWKTIFDAVADARFVLNSSFSVLLSFSTWINGTFVTSFKLNCKFDTILRWYGRNDIIQTRITLDFNFSRVGLQNQIWKLLCCSMKRKIGLVDHSANNAVKSEFVWSICCASCKQTVAKINKTHWQCNCRHAMIKCPNVCVTALMMMMIFVLELWDGQTWFQKKNTFPRFISFIHCRLFSSSTSSSYYLTSSAVVVWWCLYIDVFCSTIDLFPLS